MKFLEEKNQQISQSQPNQSLQQHSIEIENGLHCLPFHQGFCQNKQIKQEAHRPRFAHLSDTATADMQMLCNIFPILSSQLMKISSFEQFLVLKQNIWAWQSMEHDHLN